MGHALKKKKLMRNTSARAIIFLHKIVPNAKDLQILHLKCALSKRKGKFLSCFYGKFEV